MNYFNYGRLEINVDPCIIGLILLLKSLEWKVISYVNKFSRVTVMKFHNVTSEVLHVTSTNYKSANCTIYVKSKTAERGCARDLQLLNCRFANTKSSIYTRVFNTNLFRNLEIDILNFI